MADRLSPSGTMLATTVVAPVPHANFTHPVTWIREQARRHGFAEPRLLAFTAMNIRGGVVPVAPHGGDGPLVHITLHLDLPQMFAARELLNYPLAANRVARHEEGHVPLWEEV